MRSTALGPAFLLTLLAASPAVAELVVFESGRHVSVASFEVVEDEVQLDLRGGGRMTVPLDLVDRIVDDEVELVPDTISAPAEEAPPPPRSARTFAPDALVSGLQFAASIQAAARKHLVDPALIWAVMRTESAFSPRAISRKGARGLMQLMPATARRLGVRRPYDPSENVLGGTAYLSELARRYGDTNVHLILAAYNAGEGAVATYKGIPPYRETRDYVRKVMAAWNDLHAKATTAKVVATTAEMQVPEVRPESL